MNKMLRPALAAMVLLLVPSILAAQGTSTPAPAPATSAPASPPAAPPPPAEAPVDTTAGSPLAACRADVDTLCPGAAGGDRRKCLRDNSSKLSPACQTALTDVAAKTKAMREACQGDVATHCAGTETGEGRLGLCLRTNIAKLSPSCGTAVKARFPKS